MKCMLNGTITWYTAQFGKKLKPSVSFCVHQLKKRNQKSKAKCRGNCIIQRDTKTCKVISLFYKALAICNNMSSNGPQTTEKILMFSSLRQQR